MSWVKQETMMNTMLKTTLSTTFTPGSNLKGEAVGANWTFFLPHLEQQTVLVVGIPSMATLKVLTRLAATVTLLYRHADEQAKVVVAQQKLARPNLAAMHVGTQPRLPLDDASVDLILLTNKHSVHWVGQTPALWHELQRLRKPEGVLYYEYRGLVDPLKHLHTTSDQSINAAQAMTTQTLWLTPLQGEMQTAVLTQDQTTVAYALRHGLYRSSVDLKQWKSWAKRVKRRPPQPAAKPAQTPGQPARKNKSSLSRQLRSRLSASAKRAVIKSTKLLERVEKWAYDAPLLNRLFQRQGVLVGAAATLSAHPPAYIRALADIADIDLKEYHWVLSARGEYSTRKVLFFLTAPGQPTPAYIVKMTRDPAFNIRLENEYQALEILYARGVGTAETLPKPLFCGHHADLAIVGESIIEGESFAKKTQRNADCPYLQAAIHFLSTLGTATADHTAATPYQVAQALETLFDRFQAIYQLKPAQATFLAEQIQQIRQSPAAFPLVFQHGDPGPWNMMVTPSGQVAVLDWEAAEPQGIPLWDLFYFLRSYALDIARAGGVNDGLHGYKQQFLADTPLSSLVVETVQRYCQAIDLPTALILPLFYTCWMHRALKEATRLPVNKVDSGRFVNLLRMCIDHQTAPTLQRLSQLPVTQTPAKEFA